MTPSYTLALAASLCATSVSAATHHEEMATWSRPAMQSCGEGDANPCWTAPHIPDEVYAARFAGESPMTEICDGDMLRENSGVRNGAAFRTGPQLVSFDRAYLIEKGIAHRITDDGRACIPALDHGLGWIEPLACFNAARRERVASAAALFFAPTEYMRGGFSPAGPRTWGGASAHVASPHIPPVYVAPWPSPAPYEPVAQPESPGPGVDPLPAPPIVPLPASVWMLTAAVAMLGALAMGRRA